MIDERESSNEQRAFTLHKFKLYETYSHFYLFGKDKQHKNWRVLKIDRLDASELTISEDPCTYSKSESFELQQSLNEGNKSTGGLKFVAYCYGLVGFIKLLEPYYMILVTKRRKIGSICGHDVYGISSTKIISVPPPCLQSNLAHCKAEQRYKKLLQSVDLTKDFFFSNTYHIMWSLQKNSLNINSGQVPFESMFVWNEYLTRGIRNSLCNSNWVVALVYGFFKQERLSICDRSFIFTLIARRSKHYAGTRFIKRGVNDKGRVANDVETEQIVFEDTSDNGITQLSSVVQHRGSIPLYWSQEISILNLKPDIIVQRKDPTYQSTRLHFENLMKRYGSPIIVLNLIKGSEKKPRESILSVEYAKAIEMINRTLPEESRLRFIHLDIHNIFRSKSGNVLQQLKKLAVEVLNFTGFYYSVIESAPKPQNDVLQEHLGYNIETKSEGSIQAKTANTFDAIRDNMGSKDNLKSPDKKPIYQSGVLRTNCIDCIDRTNVAQYSYGLAALGRQLHALGLTEDHDIDLDNTLAEELMGLYEMMGDTLALQYGGSTAHNKVFCERRGQSRAAMNSQEIFRSLKRFYSNVYLDAEKQNSINVFLGHFQPQNGKPALWELQSDQNYKDAKACNSPLIRGTRGPFMRSLSDGNILVKSLEANVQPKEKPQCSSRVVASSLEEEASSTSSDSPPTNGNKKPNGQVFSRFMTSSTLYKDSFRNDMNTLVENADLESEYLQEKEILIQGESSVYNGLISESSLDSSCQEIQQFDYLDTMRSDSSAGLVNFTRRDSDGEAIDDVGSSWQENCEYCCNEDELPVEKFSDEFSLNFIRWVCHGQTLCH